MSLLSISNIDTGYGNKQVLYNVSLEVEQGDSILLVGSNGSGKSTLLKLIYGLMNVWHGKVEFNGKVLHSESFRTPSYELISKGILYLPQKNELFEDMSIEENLRCACLHYGSSVTSYDINKKLDSFFEAFPLLGNLKHNFARQLSGGERKILSFGMAIVNNPSLLLCDEPMAGLSGKNVQLMVLCLNKIRDAGTTLIVVEHRVAELIDFMGSVAGLKLGHLQTGNLETLDQIKNFII